MQGMVAWRGGPPRYHATFHLRRREDQSRFGGEEGGLNRMRTKIVVRDHPSDRQAKKSHFTDGTVQRGQVDESLRLIAKRRAPKAPS